MRVRQIVYKYDIEPCINYTDRNGQIKLITHNLQAFL